MTPEVTVMDNTPPIIKSVGVTPTERLLSDLCEHTFLSLWSYPNPFKEDGKELCDLIVVFESHIFLFFDRETQKFSDPQKDIHTSWNRWKKEAIDKQIRTANGAKRYIKSGRAIYLDSGKSQQLPLGIPTNATISKFIVAHGASEACQEFSEDNISGSLAISYGEAQPSPSVPFFLELDRNDITHVLDSQNIQILFRSLDTIFDFSSYIMEKERAIQELDWLAYCGEEDLIAHYLQNFDSENQCHYIGLREHDYNSLIIAEGEWKDFTESEQFKKWIIANRLSYLWDELIQKTCQNALGGTIGGNSDLFRGKNAIIEMAKEPRFIRRKLSDAMYNAVANFPSADPSGRLSARHVSFMQSFYENNGYVFLQIHLRDKGDYESEYRPKRQALLEIACGVTKNKFPNLKKIIGIAIDAPKFSEFNSEDFLLMECEEWSDDDAERYRKANRGINFLETENLMRRRIHTKEFPE